MNRRVAAGLLGLVLVAILAVVAIPVFLIMPFKSQTPPGVALSFALRRWAPLVTLAGLLIGVALVGFLWRKSPGHLRLPSTTFDRLRQSVPLQRILSVLALVPLGAAAWFARQNHFEWMFQPLEGVSRVEVARAGFVRPGDMVMGIVSNGAAMAYPVNQLAYHHVVNDTVGGVPIAATY